MNAAAVEPAQNRTHSKVGLISFGLALATSAATLSLLVVSFIPESGTYAARRWMNVFLIFGVGVAPLVHFCGLVLGVVGAFLKDSKKLFPVLGIVFNVLPLVGAALVWILMFWIIWAVLMSGGGWM